MKKYDYLETAIDLNEDTENTAIRRVLDSLNTNYPGAEITWMHTYKTRKKTLWVGIVYSYQDTEHTPPIDKNPIQYYEIEYQRLIEMISNIDYFAGWIIDVSTDKAQAHIAKSIQKTVKNIFTSLNNLNYLQYDQKEPPARYE